MKGGEKGVSTSRRRSRRNGKNFTGKEKVPMHGRSVTSMCEEALRGGRRQWNQGSIFKGWRKGSV